MSRRVIDEGPFTGRLWAWLVAFLAGVVLTVLLGSEVLRHLVADAEVRGDLSRTMADLAAAERRGRQRVTAQVEP